MNIIWLDLYFFKGLKSTLTGGLVVAGIGLVLIVFSIKRLASSFLRVVYPGKTSSLWQLFYRRQYLAKGPRIVAIGGGTGLAVLLKGLKKYTRNLTAIVTVADDGGSSGRLRKELNIPPPGDIRNCLVALADTEILMEELFNYRFRQGEGLSGHSLGNLLIAAMTDLSGDFDRAIQELARVLAVGGRVIPSTTSQVVMGAELTDGSIVFGESNIPKVTQGFKKKIKRVFLEPADCRPPEAALEAIKQADAVIIGPGSLYTSILPNLLVQGISEALRKTSAPVFYISNIMTQPGETDNYSLLDHIKAIDNHCGKGLIDVVIAHSGSISQRARKRYSEKGASPVIINGSKVAKLGIELRRGWLVDETYVVRHNSDSLARLIIEEIYRYQKRRRKNFICSLWGKIRNLS
ncbi:MAG: hypothetical protein PWP31_415 [Clostridia bacterium]|nr:hypothetical protein [Clostridia bacterium]